MRGEIFPEGSTVGVYGLGETGIALTKFLHDGNFSVVLFDDNPSGLVIKFAESLGLEIHVPTAKSDLDGLLDGIDIFMPTPGLPDSHYIFKHVFNAGIPIRSEFDLAAQYDDRPLVAVTGTNGKTTVTMMIKEMLLYSDIKTEAVGNTEIPLIEAIGDRSIEKFVVEASSFRLGHSSYFQPDISVWLNFSPDHLDVHQNLQAYEKAKASLWQNQSSGHIAIANAEDEIVMRHLPNTGIVKTFGKNLGDNKLVDDYLILENEKLLHIEDLKRSSPHDISNALAAAITARSAGAEISAIQKVLTEFVNLPHRIEFVGCKDGVAWYNDSKSTTPHSVIAAVMGFKNVILIAGGRNKGLDLRVLTCVQDHIKHLVAIGEASEEMVRVFDGSVPSTEAVSMGEAVAIARHCSKDGDVVLLSPGCTSFDWYRNYADRGEDFKRTVRDLVGVENGDN
ncbi:MAG TPA: UDP-N-acetylmuramoyl-L-alanine--D-glutamate ligase [Acidimicrobiales bacterium]|jgi:UDP-N-acetylmuramoylalanine--D-glutamate ligase|nr:UDP-N-acetylmuramoyl-L-alanine--D-glutamate ligase [Acidimicrobiales bacterium]HJM96636.1 UDP-N-acetylmuramoyl-L-alanine--D-glutamate ligase [Acidimicrobiales bacterium]